MYRTKHSPHAETDKPRDKNHYELGQYTAKILGEVTPCTNDNNPDRKTQKSSPHESQLHTIDHTSTPLCNVCMYYICIG